MSGTKKALIVEKTAAEAKQLADFLQRNDFVVLIESSAVRTLAIVDKSKFEFAFIACELEGIPGPDLAYQLKIKDRAMNIELLVKGPYDPEVVGKALRKARLSHFLMKPVSEKDLTAYFEGLKINLTHLAPARQTSNAPEIRSSKWIKEFSRDDLAKQIEFFRVHLKGRNHFELLGIDKSYGAKEVKKAYRDLSKVFHPDLLQSWLSPTLLSIARDFFTNMTTAYAVLSDPKKRITYEHELEHGTAAAILSAEALMDQGLSYLHQSNFPAALEKFEAVALEGVITDELKLLIVWAQMEMIGMDLAPNETKQRIFEELNSFKAKKNETAEYFYCWGLYYYICDDRDQALKNFQNAVLRKSNFVEAQRKIQIIIVSRPVHDPHKKRTVYGDLGSFGTKGRKKTG